MKTSFASALVLVSFIATPAFADDALLCESQARGVERDLGMRRDQMSLEDRMRAHQRLGLASGLCRQDSARATQDLQSLQRDVILQSHLPPTGGRTNSPGSPPGLD